jgi:hypothetical protein
MTAEVDLVLAELVDSAGRHREVGVESSELAAAAVLDGSPVREPRFFRGQLTKSGFWWASSFERLVAYESQYERRAIVEPDWDPDVVGLLEQPLRLVYDLGGCRFDHTPDLLAVHSDGSWVLIDVRPSEFQHDDRFLRHRVATEGFCDERGWEYRVDAAPLGMRSENLDLFAAARRPTDLARRLADDLVARCTEPTTLSDLGGEPAALVRQAALCALWERRLRTDLGRPFSSASVLEPWAGGHRG